jgi:phosphoserine aminotransferase
MISFYPGPSRVHDQVPAYVKDAHKLGLLSMNHRSPEFVAMSEATIKLLKSRLGIPKNYTVLFTTSATESWEIIAQSLVKEKSLHLYNGAFGQKWYEYTHRIHPGATPLPFNTSQPLDPKQLVFDLQDGIICLTQNETSNGTQVGNDIIKSIKKNNPSYLVAVDATSSMAGIKLDFKHGDVWFASVQKCFGLPAGLGLLICSPQAVERARSMNERKHYNSLPFMLDMMEKWQTPFTPNVLAIYLLMRVLEDSPSIEEVHEVTLQRYRAWISFLGTCKKLTHLTEEKSVQSYTVIPVKSDEQTITQIKKSAKKNGLLLGEGYGDWKAETFRIANFPALKQKEIKELMNFLAKF